MLLTLPVFEMLSCLNQTSEVRVFDKKGTWVQEIQKVSAVQVLKEQVLCKYVHIISCWTDTIIIRYKYQLNTAESRKKYGGDARITGRL